MHLNKVWRATVQGLNILVNQNLDFFLFYSSAEKNVFLLQCKLVDKNDHFILLR